MRQERHPCDATACFEGPYAHSPQGQRDGARTAIESNIGDSIHVQLALLCAIGLTEEVRNSDKSVAHSLVKNMISFMVCVSRPEVLYAVSKDCGALNAKDCAMASGRQSGAILMTLVTAPMCSSPHAAPKRFSAYGSKPTFAANSPPNST